MSAVDEAVEVVARALVTEWHSDQCGCVTAVIDGEGDVSECASVRAGFRMSPPMSWSIEEVIEALSAAGFLATDEEWGVRRDYAMGDGRVVEHVVNYGDSEVDARDDLFGNDHPISRRVTPWRSA